MVPAHDAAPPRSIEPMRRGPAAAPVDNAFLARYRDHVSDEALPVPVVDLRQAHHNASSFHR
jgi:hypothetical protein